MSTPYHPPQAYTREMLVKAYEWLNTQPAAVRERTPTADALMATFLQVRRRMAQNEKQESWDQPTASSVEAFKTDLRNLAEGLRQFEEPSHTERLPPPLQRPTPGPEQRQLPPSVERSAQPTAEASLFDAKTMGWVREVRTRLNLSSDQEAARAMIAIGYARLKDMLP
jgi:hypothetical protein